LVFEDGSPAIFKMETENCQMRSGK